MPLLIKSVEVFVWTLLYSRPVLYLKAEPTSYEIKKSDPVLTILKTLKKTGKLELGGGYIEGAVASR